MTTLNFQRVNALPGTLQPSTCYIVARSTGYVDLHFTSTDGSVVRHVPNTTDIQAMIDASIAASGGGGGGAGASTVIPNTTTRYEALSTANYRVHCLSSSIIYTKMSWSRAATSLTINHVGHARSVGDRVIMKNGNVSVLNALVVSKTADSFTVTCADSGAASGSDLSYTCGFNFAHNSYSAGALTSGVLSLPANCDIQLHSLRIHTPANSRTGTTYDLTVPTSVYLPAGADTVTDDVYVPLTQIRADADTMTVVGNTIAMNQGAVGYSTFRFGALGSVAQGQLMLLQF